LKSYPEEGELRRIAYGDKKKFGGSSWEIFPPP
jgi:hypothetical protein